jgi:hypothetical protein
MPYDSEGTKHIKRGPEEAVNNGVDRWLHVCYDSYFGGPTMFFYTPKRAAEEVKKAEERGDHLFGGSREGVKAYNTGYGYNIEPEKLDAKKFPFTPNLKYSHETLGKRAEHDAADWLEKVAGYAVTMKTDKTTQLQGTDLVAIGKDGKHYRIDVKSRGEKKGFPRLFIQTHETNPEKRTE